MLQSSQPNSKMSIFSVLGSEYTESATKEEKELDNEGIDRMYDDLDEELMDEEEISDEDTTIQVTYGPFCEKVTLKKELPTPLFAGEHPAIDLYFVQVLMLFFLPLLTDNDQ